MTLCECGCGEEVNPGNRFIRGHNRKGTTLHKIPICRTCNKLLDNFNWTPANKDKRVYICKTCRNEQSRKDYIAHHEARIKERENYRRANGASPFEKNRKCPSFLGVHVAEGVLKHVFKNIKRMPINNPGYDFICDNGYLIDSKAACMYIRIGQSPRWNFHIGKNTTADYFVLLAFDNRNDTVPLHGWIIPGNVLNHLVGVSIGESTIPKWDIYKIDMDKVLSCCDAMRDE